MKLYCRVKVNGKWTFRAACLNYVHTDGHVIDCDCCVEPYSITLPGEMTE